MVDVAPSRVVVWTAAETSFGDRFELPPAVRVTSRQGDSERPHYALVCASSAPLELAELGLLDFSALRNLLSGNRLGASQVTAVVSRLDPPPVPGVEYPVALRAALVAPYFVRLREPLLVSAAK